MTVHESLQDKTGKVWYHLTVDDQAVSGYMRDYVVDLNGKIAKPTATPKATPMPEEEPVIRTFLPVKSNIVTPLVSKNPEYKCIPDFYILIYNSMVSSQYCPLDG